MIVKYIRKEDNGDRLASEFIKDSDNTALLVKSYYDKPYIFGVLSRLGLKYHNSSDLNVFSISQSWGVSKRFKTILVEDVDLYNSEELTWLIYSIKEIQPLKVVFSSRKHIKIL